MTYKYVNLEATTSKKVATGLYLFRTIPSSIEGVPFKRFELVNPDTLRVVYTSGPYQDRYVSHLKDKEYLIPTVSGTLHRLSFI